MDNAFQIKFIIKLAARDEYRPPKKENYNV